MTGRFGRQPRSNMCGRRVIVLGPGVGQLTEGADEHDAGRGRPGRNCSLRGLARASPAGSQPPRLGQRTRVAKTQARFSPHEQAKRVYELVLCRPGLDLPRRRTRGNRGPSGGLTRLTPHHHARDARARPHTAWLRSTPADWRRLPCTLGGQRAAHERGTMVLTPVAERLSGIVLTAAIAAAPFRVSPRSVAWSTVVSGQAAN